MEPKIEPVGHIRNWAIDRLESAELVGDKMAIYEEFEDWIEIDGKKDIEYICLEKDD